MTKITVPLTIKKQLSYEDIEKMYNNKYRHIDDEDKDALNAIRKKAWIEGAQTMLRLHKVANMEHSVLNNEEE